jgi:hypothetical protein
MTCPLRGVNALSGIVAICVCETAPLAAPARPRAGAPAQPTHRPITHHKLRAEACRAATNSGAGASPTLPGRGHARRARWRSARGHHRQASLPPGGEPPVEIGGVPQPQPLQDHRRQARLKPSWQTTMITCSRPRIDASRHGEAGSHRHSSTLRASTTAPGISPPRPALIIAADVDQQGPPRLRRKSLHGRRAVRQPGPGLGQQIIDPSSQYPPGNHGSRELNR